MSRNIFKIHDDRNYFWQWDTKQKLIVLDDRVTEVRFSNRNMDHSKRRPVYTDSDGVRICNVPDSLLQLPKNLVAHACIKNDDGYSSTIKVIKFAVRQQPIPADYVCEQETVVEDILFRLESLESLIKGSESGTQQLIKFTSMADANKWVATNGSAGDIIIIKLDNGWVPHIVEDNLSLSAICDCSGDIITMILDGSDADGHETT